MAHEIETIKQVKIFSGTQTSKMEDAINEWLKKIQESGPVDVLDIRYSCASGSINNDPFADCIILYSIG